MTKKFLVMTKNSLTDGDMVRRASGGQSLLGEGFFQVTVAFGMVTLFAASAIHLEVSTLPPSPCDRPAVS